MKSHGPLLADASLTGTILALCLPSCTSCHGIGRYLSRGRSNTCRCVYRKVFDLVMTQVHNRTGYAHDFKKQTFKQSEWLADVQLLAMRALDGHELSKTIYRLGCVEDRDYKVVSAKVGLSRGNYFHAVYRMKEVVGRAWLETKPHAVYPTDQYFSLELPDAQHKRTKHRRIDSPFVPTQQPAAMVRAAAA
ncbi:MAG: hypothetical protein IT163_09800 [Bryobacterales bacterium]|nr:hypothetical protein [Bryobacterales bacterium]